jgi:hypothetical protein
MSKYLSSQSGFSVEYPDYFVLFSEVPQFYTKVSIVIVFIKHTFIIFQFRITQI